MDLETGSSVPRPSNGAAVLANREHQICEAAKSAKAAFAELTNAVELEADLTGPKARVFKVFRWYFLSAYCTRVLGDAAHRLEHHTLQVSMDVFSAVRMSMADSEVEVSMALVTENVTTPAAAYTNRVGCRGHSAGWIAAKLQEQGREIPAEIKNSLAGALSASVPRI